MTHYDDVNSSAVVYVGLLGVLATVLIIMAVVVYYYQYERQMLTGSEFGPPTEQLNALTEQQQAALNGPYRTLDAEQQIVALPIEHAMQLVVADVQAGRRAVAAPPEAEPAPPAETDPAAPAEETPEAATDAIPDTPTDPPRPPADAAAPQEGQDAP